MNLKLHLAVIGVMTLAILGGYSLLRSTPETTAPEAIVGDRYIRIIHAHWGLNCNSILQDEAKAAAASGAGLQKPKPKLVQPNNVLEFFRNQCERHPECTVPLRSQQLGNPSKACAKNLDIGWRCFSYDKLQTKQLSEGETLSIRCN